MMSGQPKCSECAYWQVIPMPNIKDFGECRRRAPLQSEGGYHFPVTDQWTWCGEYAKDAK